MKEYEEVEVHVHPFLMSEPGEEGGGAILCPGCSIFRERISDIACRGGLVGLDLIYMLESSP
jgi:hypothetical protein